MNKPIVKPQKKEYVQQCKHCLSIYDEAAGEPDHGIVPGTEFDKLPEGYSCPVCEAPVEDFVRIEKSELGLQPV